MPRPLAVVLAALAVVAASALPLRGGGESARAQVRSATGPLVATDGSGAVLVAYGLRPGDSRAGELMVSNEGDASGAFTLSQADRLESPGAAPLSSVLDLVVTDVTAGRIVFAGKLGALRSVALGEFAQGEGHRYRFVVAFPGGRPPALDDAYQVASTTVSYVWTAGALRPPAPMRPPPAAPPSTLRGAAPTARLLAAARQRGRGGAVRAQLTCQAACRARLGGSARAAGGPERVASVVRTLRGSGRVAVVLRLPRRARRALARGRRVTVRVTARVSIAGRSVALRKTVRLVAVRHSRHRER